MVASFQTVAGIVVLAWVAVWALLQFEHAMWSSAPFWARYIMGMGTVCLGCLAVGVTLNNPALAIVPAALSTAGLLILKSYADEAKTERKIENAQKRGELAGMAKGIHRALSQEAIDRGDDPTRN